MEIYKLLIYFRSTFHNTYKRLTQIFSKALMSVNPFWLLPNLYNTGIYTYI